MSLLFLVFCFCFCLFVCSPLPSVTLRISGTLFNLDCAWHNSTNDLIVMILYLICRLSSYGGICMQPHLKRVILKLLCYNLVRKCWDEYLKHYFISVRYCWLESFILKTDHSLLVFPFIFHHIYPKSPFPSMNVFLSICYYLFTCLITCYINAGSWFGTKLSDHGYTPGL